MTRARVLSVAAAATVVAASLLGGGCASSPRAASVPRLSGAAGAAEVPADVVPAELAGLRAAPEDVSALEKEAGSESWLSSTWLWSLRTGERLRATLQVSRFVPDAAAGDETFQRTIVAQVGTADARKRMLGGTRVFVTSGNQQLVYVWFRGRSFAVLSVAVDYPEPRSLLRAALELEP